MAEASLLQHLLTQCKGSDGSRTAASFECAASQLRVLGAPALRQAPAAELAEELLERAEQLVGSKQVRWARRGFDLCHCRE